MSTIADLLIKIGADSSGLSSELNKSKDAINSTFSASPVKEFSGSVDDVTGKINGLTSSFTKLAGLAAGGFGLNAVVQSAVNAGEAVYELGQKYQISAGQAAELNRIMSLTGGDVNTAASAIMRFDKTLTASGEAGEKARAIMSQMGLSMTDANGRLKPMNEQLSELARGYNRAREAGQGQEFVMNTLGVRGMALTKTLIEYNEAKERASHIQSIGLDVNQMHQAYMDMKEVNMQFSQLGIVTGAALAPLVSELLPSVEKDLAGVAGWIRNNKELVSGTIIEITKLAAAYEAMKVARKAINTGKEIYDKVQGTLKPSADAGEEERLSREQERIIKKSQADAEKMYAARRREAIRTAKQENLSAQEMQAFLTEKFTQIGQEAAITSERIRTEMTAAFQQANIAAQEAATGVQEANARMLTSNANVSESEMQTGTAAQESAAVKQEANAIKMASNEEVIASNAGVSESEAQTGVSAQEGAALKEEASAAKIASNESVMASNAELGATEVAAGEKSVAASTMAASGLAQVEGKAKDTAKAHVVAGTEAVKTGAKTVGAAAQGFGAIGKVTSALYMMAGGWMGVAAAALYAAYCAFKYFNAKYEAAKSNTWTGDDGYTYVNENGRFYRLHPENDTPDVDPMGLGDVGNGGATKEEITKDSNPELYGILYTNFGNQEGSETYNYEQAQKAAKEAQEQANAVNNNFPAAFDLSGFGDDDGSGKKKSGASAKAEKAASTVTRYSFEDDPELAQWANQIKYAANYHGIDPRLLAAVIKRESHGRTGPGNDWSSDYAHYGLAQISQDIADTYNGGQGYGEGSDPNQNILAAAAYLADLYNTYGDVSQTISAYNAGHPTGSNQAYVNDVMGYMSAMTATQVSGSSAANTQPVAYDIPVGEYVAYRAVSDYYDGEQWRGELGNDVYGWCDDFTHDLYERVFSSLGRQNPFAGGGVVNDEDFKALGAYHEGNLEAVRGALQPGDLVDTPGHVGVYIGNGMVRSRQSSAGVHDLSLDEFNSTFGGIQGYGSIAEASGNMQVTSTLVGKTASNKAAAEAARKLAKAKQDYADIVAGLQAALNTESGTEYESGLAKVQKAVADQMKKIRAVDNVGGVDTSYAKELLKQYRTAELDKVNQKLIQNQQKLKDETAKINAEVKGDYTALYDAELKAAVERLEKEKQERFKAVAQHKNDIEAMKAVEEWYTAEVNELTQKREQERAQEFDKAVQSAISNRNMSAFNQLFTSQKSKQGLAGIDWEGKGKAMTEFYSLWKDANISTMDIAAEAASSLESGLSNVFSDLGSNIENVGKLADNMGKVILTTITSIVAKWSAAKITMGLLGGFMGMGASSAGWNYSSGYGSWYSGAGLPEIPKFANGGRVTAPTLAMIGEGQDEEGVFPLNSDTYSRIASGIVAARGGGGNAPVVNIINNSSSQVSVKDSHYDNNLRRWVLNAVVEDVNNNVDGSATNLKAALGVK